MAHMFPENYLAVESTQTVVSKGRGWLPRKSHLCVCCCFFLRGCGWVGPYDRNYSIFGSLLARPALCCETTMSARMMKHPALNLH